MSYVERLHKEVKGSAWEGVRPKQTRTRSSIVTAGERVNLKSTSVVMTITIAEESSENLMRNTHKLQEEQ